MHMPSTTTLSGHQSGTLTTRNKHGYGLLGKINNDSSIFSSHMAYNSSVMSMKAALKEKQHNALRLCGKPDDCDSIILKVETDIGWKMILDQVKNKDQFYKLAF